jgi:hypothetical protein
MAVHVMYPQSTEAFAALVHGSVDMMLYTHATHLALLQETRLKGIVPMINTFPRRKAKHSQRCREINHIWCTKPLYQLISYIICRVGEQSEP